MMTLLPNLPHNRPLRVMCLGAHCDDIEIGCGGTLLRLTATRPVEVSWIVFSSNVQRKAEATAAAEAFLTDAADATVRILDYRDGFLPDAWKDVKEDFEELRKLANPDMILTHRRRGDAHQDHRLIGELTWNTFRDHFIAMYEIPKFEGDLGQPDTYVPLPEGIARRKVELLMKHYETQAQKRWFDEELFMGLMRLRALETGDVEPYAEGFHCRKTLLV